MTDPFSIENMKAELARALNKADEDAKTMAKCFDNLNDLIVHVPKGLSGYAGLKSSERITTYKIINIMKLLTNNKPNIDFPLSLQDEAK